MHLFKHTNKCIFVVIQNFFVDFVVKCIVVVIQIFINNLVESNKITKEASFRLKISDVTTPRLYGLAKLHKENIPLRPIVSFTDSPTYGLAKELSSLLKPLIEKSKHHVRNSSDFASSITHELLQTDEIMAF